MANRCAGLDPTWAHLPAPAPTHAAGSHYYSSPACRLLTPAAAFENEALTSALRASMAAAPAHAAAASSFSCPATPSSSTSSASELLSSGYDHEAPAAPRPARAVPGPGPKGGRVTKRRARPSRRAQTTYIHADPANFRRMVQEITGLPVPGPSSSPFPAAGSEADATLRWMPVPVLPTLDTSAFLLDRAAAVPAAAPEPEHPSPTSGEYACTATDAVASTGDDHDQSMLLELEALVGAPAGACSFPTLDLESWGIV